MLAFLGLFILTLLAVLGTMGGGLLMIGGVAFVAVNAMLPQNSLAFGPLRLPLPQAWAAPLGITAAVLGLALYIAAGALLAASLP